MSNSEGPRPPFSDDLSFLSDVDRALDDQPPIGDEDPFGALPGDEHPLPPSAGSAPGKPRTRPLLDLFPPTPTAVRRPDSAPPRRDAPSSPADELDLSLQQPRRQAPLRVVPQRGSAPADREATYEIFYALNEKPFSATADLNYLYHSMSHDRAAQEILSAIGRRDPMVVLTGDAGTGKTTLCRAVIEEIDRRTFTSFLTDPFVTAQNLLKTILIDFGVLSRADIAGGRLANATPDELKLSLREFLKSLADLGAFAVVFIDDAHNLSPEALEGVRELVDLETAQRLLQIVLVAQPELLDTLERRANEQLDQRVSVRRTLDPLQEDEVPEYVLHRLAVAGGGQSRIQFDDEAWSALYQLSGGNPGVINTICDRVLMVGFEESASLIEAPLVNRAAGDLGLVRPPGALTKVAMKVAAVVALIALILVGGELATLVFHDQFDRALREWTSISPPAPPVRKLAVPIVPVPPPADDRLPPPRRAQG